MADLRGLSVFDSRFKPVGVPMLSRRARLKDQIKVEIQNEQLSHDGDKEHPQRGNIASCREFLAREYDGITPLIGTADNALQVPGEGIMLPGTGGVGKTLYLSSIAASASIGEMILAWEVKRPLKVLFYQAELPQRFFQQRIARVYESYKLSNEKRAELILDNLFIVDVTKPFDLAASDDQAIETIGEAVDKVGADLVCIDPFLSFYSGNENDNGEVRRNLDRLKHLVAEPLQCGIIITDHQPKYSESNPDQNHSIRGAGAKRDWAATVISLNRTKTPAGQHGTFLKVTIDKMRYGKLPRNPFTIKRDDFSFRHIHFRESDVEPCEIAQILDESGSGLSTRAFQEKVVDALSISDHDARKAIKKAVDEKWIVTESGARNSIIHDLGDRYVEWRKN